VRRAGRGKCWEVVMDGRLMERFSRLETAVEAVDFELERLGRSAVASAAAEAAWRRAPPPIGGEATDRRAANLAEALRLSVWHHFHPRGARAI
jgi:ATP-dependent helicase IRC3